MIYLDSTTKKLEIALAGSVSSTEPHVVVCYYDVPATAKQDYGEYKGGTTVKKTSGASPVTICEAPSVPNVTRNIAFVSVQNADNATAVATIRVDDGGTDYYLMSQTMAAGKSLVYDDGNGWQVL